MPRVPKLPPTSCISTRTFSGGNAEHGREIDLQPHRAAVAGMDGVAAGVRIVRREHGARLHRHAGDALHPGLELRHMRGARKRGLGRRGVAKLCIEADIGARLIVHARRILARRRHRVGHARQRLVVDLDKLRAVLGRPHGVGDNHRHRLADEAHLVGRQQIMRRGEGFGAVRILQRNFRRVLRPLLVRNGFEPVGLGVGTGEHRDHARRGHRLVGRDAADARVRVRRAHHDGVDLPRQILVGGIAAFPRTSRKSSLRRTGWPIPVPFAISVIKSFHCIGRFAFLITLPHRFISSAKNLPASWREPGAGSIPMR